MSATPEPGSGTSLADVTLLIFSCEGRSHLVSPTVASFHERCPFAFGSTIRAHDGAWGDAAMPDATGVERLVLQTRRRGYVQNILQGLALVNTPFVFWLEDDWEFTRDVDLPSLRSVLLAHPDWVQIRLSKEAPLTPEQRQDVLHAPDILRSACGFSANPSLNRTAHLRSAFAAYLESPREAWNTFESYLTPWFQRTGLICAVIDPGATPPIAHRGYLESTGRQWHAASSLAEAAGALPYRSGLRAPEERLPLWRRGLMALRLLRVAGVLAVRLLWHPRAYDLAFRFLAANQQKD